ncbi:alpha/beta fold hydrolase [Stappia sp. ES.058]|uniref:alpha/beta fold hydrolase n=1 Tax=Stappia sp. ES.058 TaxID=1881061 RepID=UPI00087DC768|nr:alpha/beta fold hydrolase [Stappia sp. ES.058]SDU18533.1 homoserine O-acetyltransferase [Stappia sp. ES.058]
MSEGRIYRLGDIRLASGHLLTDAQLVYETWGRLNGNRDNVILIPTFFTGCHRRSAGYIESMPALDPDRYFIVSINMFGNSLSTSPSNVPPSASGDGFPVVSLQDNVECQAELLRSEFGITRLRLVMGWSMAACQAFQWAVQFPDLVDAILPICGTARTSAYTKVQIDGLGAILGPVWRDDGRTDVLEGADLGAFGRVYAGWAFSREFFTRKTYTSLGYSSPRHLLDDWEQDHLAWHPGDLASMLRTWRVFDIADTPEFRGDLDKALASIMARAVIVPCTTDLFFAVADSVQAVAGMRKATLKPYASDWGHCVALPGRNPAFTAFLNAILIDLLGPDDPS